MKLVYATLCFIFISLSFLTEAQSAFFNEKNLVRVRLKSVSEQRLAISGTGLRFQNLEQPYRAVAIPQNSQAEVRLLEKSGKSLWALRFSGQDREHLFPEKFLLIQGEGLRLGSQPLPKKVILNSDSKKNVDVVGVMPLEEYIVGVLASEMPLAWPLETLKAQAVAARSYALAVMNERKDKTFHLESSILDQVFRHVLHEDENDPLIKNALQAVRETEGQVLSANSGKVLKAFFHSDCGGKTTTPKNVWSAGVNTGVAVDSSCPLNPRAHWKLSLSRQELERRLSVAGLQSLELKRGPSDERILEVKIAASNGMIKKMSANEFRQKIGFQELRSSLFQLNKDGDRFVFAGQGYGHGVGLCQWGSRALGKNGKSYQEILKHYYPLAKLETTVM